jgi:hypothetical protein
VSYIRTITDDETIPDTSVTWIVEKNELDGNTVRRSPTRIFPDQIEQVLETGSLWNLMKVEEAKCIFNGRK